MLVPLLFGVSSACKSNAGEGYRAHVFNPNQEKTTTSESYNAQEEFFDKEFVENVTIRLLTPNHT